MFKVVLLSDCHSVGEANLHLQFTPKYRKPVFEDEVLRSACELAFKGVAKRLHVGLAGLGFGPDHCHLFITRWKNYSIAELARRFKGTVSRVLRKAYALRLNKWLWGKALWTGAYFYRTVGAVTSEAMYKYVTEAQQKHWIKQEPTANPQTTLLQFR